MPLLFLSAPGIGTRYSDSYSEHLPAVVRSRNVKPLLPTRKSLRWYSWAIYHTVSSRLTMIEVLSHWCSTPHRKNMPCSCLQDSALLQSDYSPFPHGQAESRQAIPHHGTKPEKMPVRCHWTTKCSPEEYWWNKVSSYRYNMSTPAAYWSRPKWAKPSGWYWQTKRGCQNSVFENMNL